MNRKHEELHEPECCCQYNPSTPELQENVLASECCPVHKRNPKQCLADEECEHCEK